MENAPNTTDETFAKFQFEEELTGGNLTPKQQREAAFAEGKQIGEQSAAQQYQQQLQTELAQRDTQLSQALAQLSQARIDFESGLQEQTLELVQQLLKTALGDLIEKASEKLLKEHIPTLLAQASSGMGGTITVHVEQQAVVEKSVPQNSGFTVQTGNHLRPGQLELQWKSGTAVLDLPDFFESFAQALEVGKALAKQQKHSKVAKTKSE